MRGTREYDKADEFFSSLEPETNLLVEYVIETYDYDGRVADTNGVFTGRLVEVSSFPRYIVMEDSLGQDRVKIHLDHILAVTIL